MRAPRPLRLTPHPSSNPNPTTAEDGPGGPHWIMVGLVPLFDPPRHDTKETIERCHAVRGAVWRAAGRAGVAGRPWLLVPLQRACRDSPPMRHPCRASEPIRTLCCPAPHTQMGIMVKMITGDQLLIGKETAKQLGMGTNMFTTEALLKVCRGCFVRGYRDCFVRGAGLQGAGWAWGWCGNWGQARLPAGIPPATHAQRPAPPAPAPPPPHPRAAGQAGLWPGGGPRVSGGPD